MPAKPANITRSQTTYNTTTANVTFSWNPKATSERVDTYHVNVSYEPQQMQMVTLTPAVTVEGIPYDQQVVVSVVAVNCYSDSERAYINSTISESIKINACYYPMTPYLCMGRKVQ